MNSPDRNEYGDYSPNVPIQQHFNEELNSYDPIYDVSSNRLPASPIPTASSAIYLVNTIAPSIDVHPHHVIQDKLSLDRRQSISAQPTYVVSAKLTNIDDNIRIVPNRDGDSDEHYRHWPLH